MAGRTTQVSRRVVVSVSSGKARTTQVGRRTVVANLASARVSQAVIEVLDTTTEAYARVSQAPIEVLETTTDAYARVSQAVVEVLRPFKGSFEYGFGVEAEVRGSGLTADFKVDAVVFGPQAGSKTVDAVRIQRGIAGAPFTLSAQLGPRFSVNAVKKATIAPVGGKKVDAAIVWKQTGAPFTLSALLKAPRPFTTKADAFVQPYFRVDARVDFAPHPFLVAANIWARLERNFLAGADISAVGDKRGLIYLDAVIRETPVRISQAGIHAARTPADRSVQVGLAGLQVVRQPDVATVPVRVGQAGFQVARDPGTANVRVGQGGFQVARDPGVANVQASQLGYQVTWRPLDGTIKVSQLGYQWAWTPFTEPRATVGQLGFEIARYANPIVFAGQLGIQVAIEKPRGTWALNAMFYRPGAYMPPASMYVAAEIVIRRFGSFSAAAFISPWFKLDAALRGQVLSGFAVAAEVVYKRYGSFTLAAFKRGFILSATIRGGARPAIFTVFARVEGTDWGPWGETWDNLALDERTGTLSASAITRRNQGSSFTLGSWLVSWPWPRWRTFSADARLQLAPSGSSSAGFEIDASIVPWYRTVVYEGVGQSHVETVEVRDRLTFPGIPNDWRMGWSVSQIPADNANNVYGPFYPAAPNENREVAIVLYELPGWVGWGAGIHAAHDEDGVALSGPGEYFLEPRDWTEPYFVYVSNAGAPYDPAMTGSGMVIYEQDQVVIDSHPAPTIDAFVVGTEGTPFTVDAEIIDRLHLRSFVVSSELSKVGERRGQFTADASIRSRHSFAFLLGASFCERGFTLDATFVHRGFVVGSFVQPYFRVDAVLLKRITPVATTTGKGPSIDAVVVELLREKAISVGAELTAAGDRRGLIRLDAVIKATRSSTGPRPGPARIYLLAYIGLAAQGFGVDAFIGRRFNVAAFIQPWFTVGAYIRGSSYIIYPEDGGPPTDPFGNPPTLGRSFRLRIMAGIPDPIPVGNDAEIERLIALILEAEAELEALCCAVTHYSSQGATSAGTSGRSSNPSGSGYNRGSLPGVLNQVVYPGAGDVDDCWVVATVWAAIASGETFKPTVPQFRAWARNPDRPGPTGGSLDHVIRGARGAWPNHYIKRYNSTDWNGFISLLKAGWIASLAVRSSGLPSNLRFGFNGNHQIGVAYQDGKYWIANPLAPNNSRPREISGSALRTAARGFSGGRIQAALFA